MKATDLTVSDAAARGAGASTLLAWCIENKATAPPQLLRIATVLATHPEMGRAWQALGKLGMRPVEDVLFDVVGAWSDAVQEVNRPSASEEREKIERVIRLSCELAAAIDEAPLQKGRRILANAMGARALLLGPSPPPPLFLAWGNTPARGESEFTLSLRTAVKAIEDHARLDLFHLRCRMVTRRRGKETPPVVAAFVRYLAYRLWQLTDGEQPAIIARIVTALFEESPQTPRSVRKLLKDSPAEKGPLDGGT